MKQDVLQQYISLQAALQREREELVTRIQHIDQALGQPSPIPQGPSGAAARGRRGRGSNSMSLRDAVLQVTAMRPMSKQEIYEAVQRLGYRFGGKDPLNSLGVVLYGKNPRFKNEGGRFSPTGGAANGGAKPSGRRGGAGISAAGRARIAAAQRARWAKTRGQSGGGAASGRKRRHMSAEGRARIAAAARARWAKVRAAKA